MRGLRRVGAVVALAFIVAITLLAVSAQEEHDSPIVYNAWLTPDETNGTALLYLTIENSGHDAVRLATLETPGLDAEVVTGAEDALVIEPDEMMQFAPDETAARLILHEDAPLPLSGVLLRLTFTMAHDDEPIPVEVPVLWVDEVPQVDDLIVYDGWARPTALEADAAVDASEVVGGAYFTLENRGHETDALVGVTSPRAGMIELHETQVTNDIARMRPVDAIVLEPGAQVHLEPGGLHLMLMDLPEHLLPGDVVPLTLHFASGHEVMAGLVVRDERTDPEAHHHSH